MQRRKREGVYFSAKCVKLFHMTSPLLGKEDGAMKIKYLPVAMIVILFGVSLALSYGIAYSQTSIQALWAGPYLQNVRPKQVTLCWITNKKVSGAVSFWQTDKPSGKKQVADQTLTEFHRIHLKGLIPSTFYRYRIFGSNRNYDGEFRTSPPTGSAAPVQFAVYGDNRTQYNIHAEVIKAMTKYSYDFILHTGDEVADGSNLKEWGRFFSTAEPLLRNTPYFPELGNHEGENPAYFRFFNVPRNYSFNYGDIHFIALDTNAPASEYSRQESWLRRDLAEHKNAKWKILFCHHPFVTCTAIRGRREEASRLLARLGPILKAGGVQLVFSGHDHNYQRHVINGITYIVTGGGGAPLYPVRMDTPYVKKAVSVYHFCKVDIKGDTLDMSVFTPDGKMIDKTEIKSR